jgi:LPXTG-site transpeptidase (sortase) family protein
MTNPTGDTNEDDVSNTANYLLVEAGANGNFDTASCAGGLAADDLPIAVDTAAYTTATHTADLTINGGAALPDGSYRLFVCGTTSVYDSVGNVLNGWTVPRSDHTIDFTVQAADSSLPATGFRYGEVTQLPNQPAAKAYTDTAMTLEIPKLGVSTPIVGVPQSGSGWDVTWLGNSAGYLAGSAFPTWAGNTVITGHVWDSFNRPGVFSEIKSLKYGDQIEIQAWGQNYIYEVRESKLVTRKNVNAVFQSEQYDWVTLVTCEFYNPFTGDYLFRRSVRAVLVSVE